MAQEITIRPVSNGFIVQAGCLELVFSEPGVLRAEFSRWSMNPLEVEREYAERYIAPAQAKAMEEMGAGKMELETPRMREERLRRAEVNMLRRER